MAAPVVLTSAERAAMRAAAETDARDPRGNDGVAMVRAVERIIWDRLYSPDSLAGQGPFEVSPGAFIEEVRRDDT